jgi:uncharacterized protein YcfL
MKKLFLLGLLALLLAGCETASKGPEYGWLDVYNKTTETYLGIDIIDANGNICKQGLVKKNSFEYYTLPTGRYTIKAYGMYYYENEKTATIVENKTSTVTFL